MKLREKERKTTKKEGDREWARARLGPMYINALGGT
jgi:hypothetical protein